MPAETRNYVPKLQAVKNIIANPAQYGITLPRDRQPAVLRHRRQDPRHRRQGRRPTGRIVDRRIQGAQSAVQPPGHHRRDATTRSCCRKSNAEKFKANLAQVGPCAVDLDRAQGDRRARTHRDDRPEIPHHAGSDPRGQQYSAADGVEGRLDHPGAEDRKSRKRISRAEVVDTAMLALEPDVPATRRIKVKVGKHDTLASIAAAASRHRGADQELEQSVARQRSHRPDPGAARAQPRRGGQPDHPRRQRKSRDNAARHCTTVEPARARREW